MRRNTRARVVAALVMELEKTGQEIVNNELASVTYTHRTMNLRDSYGWCVFVNGRPRRMGFAGPAQAEHPRKLGTRFVSGRDEIVKYFNERHVCKGPVELVVAVAMPYGMVVEEKYKYQVFSIAANSVKQATAKYKGAEFEYIRNRR